MKVEGWAQQAYLHSDARLPRSVHARGSALAVRPAGLGALAHRAPVRLPLPHRDLHAGRKRVHGYYVLPFLLGDTLVARVDLKADRKTGVLKVLSAFAEPGAPAGTAVALITELRDMAAWLGLERIEISRNGDLAAALADAALV